MKLNKKILAVLMCVVIILGTVAVGGGGFADLIDTLMVKVHAASVDDLTYAIINDTVEITGCNKNASGSMVIPDTIESKVVISIDDNAFSDCTGLTSITIPDSVTSIGEDAFKRCTGLTSINIPTRVTVIDDSTFLGCTGLTSITIPKSITCIGKGAFDECTGLTSVTISDNVKYILGFAFSGCTGLEKIVIPGSVTSIGEHVFSNCDSLKSIEVAGNNPVYHSAGNCLIETESKTLVAGCKTSIIPDDGSVTSIGSEAFYKCTGLASITIPGSVTSIGEHAFSGCTGLTNLYIPHSVESIGDYAFLGCNRLTSINVDSENTVYHSSGNCLIITDAQSIILGCQNSIIPDDGSVSSVYYDAFCYCDELTSIRIPDGFGINKYAFAGCTRLKELILGKNISISESAFKGCTGLTDIYFSGSESDWNRVDIDENNEPLFNATIHFNSSRSDQDYKDDGLRAIINNTSLSYIEGEYIVVAVSHFKNGNETRPANLSATSSDNNIISIEYIYDYDDLPLKIEKLESFKKSKIILAKAKTSGAAVISLYDSDTGSAREIPINVVKDISGRFRFNDISTIEYVCGFDHDYYNGFTDGIYISDFSCSSAQSSSGEAGWNISMNLYNENYCSGVIEIHDKMGKLIDVREIDKFERSEGIVDLFEAGWSLIKDAFNGDTFSFRATTTSKHTSIENLFVPQDGFFVVTADCSKSKCCSIVNGIDLMFECWSAAKDFKSFVTGVNSLSADNIKDIKAKVFLQLLLSEEYLNFAEKFQEKMVKKAYQSLSVSALESFAGDLTLDVEYFLEEIGLSLDGLLKAVIGTGVGIAEDLFYKCSPPGRTIEGLFLSNKIENLCEHLYDLQKNITGKQMSGAYTPYKTYNQGILKNDNIEVHTQNSVPDETVLQSYRIINGDTYVFDLETGELLNRDYELYEISLWYKGSEIQPDGEVTVCIDSPFEQAIVAKVDENGHWSIVSSEMVNGMITFTVNHFCRFAVIDNQSDEHTIKFISDGKTVSEKKLKEGDAIVKPADPVKDGYTFKGWGAEVPAKMPAKDLTFTAVFDKNPDKPDTPENPSPTVPDIKIKGYTKELKVDYKSKLTFNVENAPVGYKIVWDVNGNKTESPTLTINQATEKEYKITANLVKDGKTVKSSETETVTVNTGFFAKIIAFFRGLFKALPEHVDNKKTK